MSSSVMVPAMVRILTTLPCMEPACFTRATALTDSASCASSPPSICSKVTAHKSRNFKHKLYKFYACMHQLS